MAKVATSVREIELPQGTTATIADGVVTVKGPKGTLTRDCRASGVDLAVEDGSIIVRADLPRRKEKALVGTFGAHIANMVRGVNKEFEFTLKTVFSHFPIKAKVDGQALLIENFLGERYPRHAPILPDTKVQVKGDQITVSGANREHVGQTAANIEHATKVKRRDVRVFQDGIYITSRGR